MDSACHGPEQQDDVQEMPFHISIHQAHRSFLGFQGGGEANVTFLIQSSALHVVELFQAIDEMFCGNK